MGERGRQQAAGSRQAQRVRSPVAKRSNCICKTFASSLAASHLEGAGPSSPKALCGGAGVCRLRPRVRTTATPSPCLVASH